MATMGNCTLFIQVDQAGIDSMEASGQQIVIARTFNAINPYPYMVVCAAFQPFGFNNTVLFASEWEAYVSLQPLGENVRIEMRTFLELDLGQQCTFKEDGFGPATSAYSTSVFGIANQNNAYPTITAGVAQKLSVNDGGEAFVATIAATAPFNETAYFQPLDEIEIFVASSLPVGQLILSAMLNPANAAKNRFSQLVGKSSTVNLSTTPVIHFDSLNNVFVNGPLAS